MPDFNLNRRKFIQGATAVLTLSALQAKGVSSTSTLKNMRVGLIGAGWYGKSDLFRLMQVRDIDVVAVCDVDSKHLAEAGKLISERQISRKVPKLTVITEQCSTHINWIWYSSELPITGMRNKLSTP
ncbi:hypothetical protein [Sphingobacterium sp. IITKGP-BTPF85]|uniref:hypothetical protein n=1 Tax=Sphingobacterium sp. IITKGP-BTPF85 TaxID=1338009 RepID=UPI000637E770|nr:hypothetical protein [Sphingobacterium sp. IITKGP-BTPF85]KKX47812.1 hypothetical protein L950_0224565 [Sphingobacterium sp. IITKGP-BTPF85]